MTYNKMRDRYEDIEKVCSLIPQFNTNDVFGNLAYNIVNSHFTMLTTHSLQNDNFFVGEIMDDRYASNASVLYHYVVRVDQDNRDHYKKLIRDKKLFKLPATCDYHTLTRLVSKTRCKYTRDAMVGAKRNSFYIISDDRSLRTLNTLVEYGLVESIIHVMYLNHSISSIDRGVVDLLQREYGVRVSDSDSDVKLTKVMKKLLEDNDISSKVWYDALNRIEKDATVRVNFRFDDSNVASVNTLLKELTSNDVVPIRFNWDKTRSKVVGAYVICPYDHYNKFKSKLKLFGVNSVKLSVCRDHMVDFMLSETVEQK